MTWAGEHHRWVQQNMGGWALWSTSPHAAQGQKAAGAFT